MRLVNRLRTGRGSLLLVAIPLVVLACGVLPGTTALAQSSEVVREFPLGHCAPINARTYFEMKAMKQSWWDTNPPPVSCVLTMNRSDSKRKLVGIANQ